MRMIPVIGAVAVTALVWVIAAAAKEFGPGDLSICSRSGCAPIAETASLKQLGAFYYGPESPPRIGAPRRGAPYFQLRFENGYVTGIVAGDRLDRFLSYGVHIGYFQRGRWYRVPDRVTAELKRLTSGFKPLRLTRAAIAKSR